MLACFLFSALWSRALLQSRVVAQNRDGCLRHANLRSACVCDTVWLRRPSRKLLQISNSGYLDRGGISRQFLWNHSSASMIIPGNCLADRNIAQGSRAWSISDLDPQFHPCIEQNALAVDAPVELPSTYQVCVKFVWRGCCMSRRSTPTKSCGDQNEIRLFH